MKTSLRISATLLVIVLVTLVWGNRCEPRRLDISRHTVKLPNLPAALNGTKVVFIADFQVGMWLGNEDIIPDVVKIILGEEPDAVLLGGDFIYHPTDDDEDDVEDEWEADDKYHTAMLIKTITDHLQALLNSKIPTFAVLGNHDYSMAHTSARLVEESAVKLTASLKAHGAHVLHNQSYPVQIGDHELYIVGIAPHYPNFDQPLKALDDVPPSAPRIVFMHNGNSIDRVASDLVPFAVAGHTHGGQVRIPGLPSWTWTSLVPHTPDDVMGDGWIRDYKGGQSRLYVNRGIGFSTVPLRINCPPEISVFTFESAM